MAYSFQVIQAYDDPNSGRSKINSNFSQITGTTFNAVLTSGPTYSASSEYTVLVSGGVATTIYLPTDGVEIEVKDYLYSAATHAITVKVAGDTTAIRKGGSLSTTDVISTNGQYKKYRNYNGYWQLMFTGNE